MSTFKITECKLSRLFTVTGDWDTDLDAFTYLTEAEEFVSDHADDGDTVTLNLVTPTAYDDFTLINGDWYTGNGDYANL